MVSETDQHKQCPDCAERVLLAARKCRYCGYRFDKGRRERGSVLAGLIPGIVTHRQEATLPEMLADWGVALAEGELVAFFQLALVDERPGYLLVTSERLIFFAQISRREHAKWVEFALASLTRVAVTGSRIRPRLELHGPDTRHVVQGMVAADTRKLDVYLSEHAVGVAAGGDRVDRTHDQW